MGQSCHRSSENILLKRFRPVVVIVRIKAHSIVIAEKKSTRREA
jgi:hypothetical protein